MANSFTPYARLYRDAVPERGLPARIFHTERAGWEPAFRSSDLSNVIPAEWSPHREMWVGFPSDAELWLDDLAPTQAEVASLARALAGPGGGAGQANGGGG